MTSPESDKSVYIERACAAEAMAEDLREENHRLQAALAVERASRASDELQRARSSYHRELYRISRLLRIFDALDMPRPSVSDDDDNLNEFIPDSLLQELRARYHSNKAANHVTVKLSGEESGSGNPLNDQPDTQMEASNDDMPGKGDAPAHSMPEPRPARTGEYQGPVVEEPPGTTAELSVARTSEAEDANSLKRPKSLLESDFPESDVLPASIIDDTNPAAECLRILIGASSVAVFEEPRRVKITIDNPDKQREVSFWLAWKDGSMEYTQESVRLEDLVCPDFLKEYAIDFELAQAPRFLLLVLGAVFDMQIVPKEES